MAVNVKKIKFLTLFSRPCWNCVTSPTIRTIATRRPSSNSDYCVNVVKKSDYESYLCTLLLPNEVRSSAFAIRALNIETMQIRDLVSEKATGLLRLQFWRDSIERIYQGSVPKSPVAIAIAKAVERHKLSKHWFHRLIDGREENLHDRAFGSIKQLEDYAENTNSSITYLILESLGVKDLHADHAASHLGKAQGLLTLVRGIAINASKERVYLPTELMIRHNVSEEDVIRGCKEQKMKDLVFDIASNANIHLETARSFQKDVPKAAVKALLPSVCCDAYLRTIQKADFDVFCEAALKRDSMIAFKIWKQNLWKKY